MHSHAAHARRPAAACGPEPYQYPAAPIPSVPRRVAVWNLSSRAGPAVPRPKRGLNPTARTGLARTGRVQVASTARTSLEPAPARARALTGSLPGAGTGSHRHGLSWIFPLCQSATARTVLERVSHRKPEPHWNEPYPKPVTVASPQAQCLGAGNAARAGDAGLPGGVSADLIAHGMAIPAGLIFFAASSRRPAPTPAQKGQCESQSGDAPQPRSLRVNRGSNPDRKCRGNGVGAQRSDCVICLVVTPWPPGGVAFVRGRYLIFAMVFASFAHHACALRA